MHVENSDETVATRYFHKDHLGSISVITDESGAVLERLSYDAWGKRRHTDGSDDPSGSITSQTSRGFTGHEELDSVGLVHMNGRVYDPLLARFGTADPMTESPFSTQGWNRYSYVGNSPLNFTDPSGYCFMGCFWKSAFRAIGNFFRENWRSLVQIAAVVVMCGVPANPICAGVVTGIVVGITSGDLGQALRAGLIAAVTAVAPSGGRANDWLARCAERGTCGARLHVGGAHLQHDWPCGGRLRLGCRLGWQLRCRGPVGGSGLLRKPTDGGLELHGQARCHLRYRRCRLGGRRRQVRQWRPDRGVRVPLQRVRQLGPARIRSNLLHRRHCRVQRTAGRMCAGRKHSKHLDH